tara:strand:- start:248 stop:514 length:267 start_codon:yes stop_codon:yes gene_type:complete
MKNKMIDLNNHLFAQLERLSDEDLQPEQIKDEINRTKAMVDVSDQIIKNAALGLEAQKFVAKHRPLPEGTGDSFLDALQLTSGGKKYD